MKAPDKIYVRDFGDSLCKVWTYNKGKKKGDVDVEYVRKDLLLEWAKEQSASCDGAVAMKRAYDKLIERLNSL